jgi:flagellar motor switch protein FliG
MIYFIYDELGLIRQVKSKTEAKYLVSLRPDWKIVAKKIKKSVFKFEDALF